MTTTEATHTAIEHRPAVILSPDSTGIRATHGCTCGDGPRKGASNRNTMGTWFNRHARKHGVDPYAAPAPTYATGRGYAAEGLTFDQWYAKAPGVDPFTGQAR